MIPTSMRRFLFPLTIRDFRFLWFGKAVSAAEGAMRTIALVWLVMNMTHSSIALSGALLALAIPNIILLLIGGVVSDQYNPRTVMVFCNLLRALVAFSIAGLAAAQYLSIPLLYGLLVIQGIISGIYSPATQSIVPRLVPSEKLQAANSLEQISPQMVFLVGAPAGGAFIAWLGPIPCFAFNGLFLLLSAFLIFRISPIKSINAESGKPPSGSSMLKDALTGLKYAGKRSWLWGLTLADALSNFAFAGPYMIALPILAKHQPSIGSEGYGFLLAAFSGGTLAGLLISGIINETKKHGLPLALLGMAQVPFIIWLAFAPLPFALLCLVIIGMLNGMSGIIYTILIQKKVDPAMLGRMMSVATLAAVGLQPLSQLAAGVFVESFNAQSIFLFAAVLIFIGSTGSLLIPSVRRI